VVATIIKKQGVEGGKQWLTKLPPTPLKWAAQQDFCEQWLAGDAVAASEWIASLPASSEREASILALVSNTQKLDPERAFGWAKQFQNETMRLSAMQQTMQLWLQTNPLAAVKALELTPPEFRETFQGSH
jgi:hypothetical protein